MAKQSVRDIDFQGKRVFVRVDFNVPIKDGVVQDATRIEAAVPTVEYIAGMGGKVILASHLGRPKGKPDATFSLEPVAAELAKRMGRPVVFVPDCVGPKVVQAVASMRAGDVVLLENTRFYREEEQNDPEFSRKLAESADIYVCDAFGSAHRAHASTAGMTAYIAQRVTGFLMEKELEYLSVRISQAEAPFVAILGGAKVSDKIPVIENLFDKVHHIIIGGAMAYTFLSAQGIRTGKSMVEESMKEYSLQLLATAQRKGVKVHLPVDHVAGREFSEVTEKLITPDAHIPDGYMGLDIGPRTRQAFQEIIAGARTVLWNGPMGVFEWQSFAEGTFAIAAAMANNTAATTIVGGGDSVSAIQQSGLADRVSHISTGGGASLELLSGVDLPGVACLSDK